MSRLQAMQLFVDTVRYGSFSDAARHAGLTPGSVSRRITDLERSLDVQLFTRTTRRISLTEAGRVYHAHVEKILDAIAAAGDAAMALQETPRGTLRVHSRTLFAVRLLAPLLPLFQSRYPEIRLELRLSERPVHLRDEECDVDFRIAPPRDTGLMQRKLFASERILVASPGYLARNPSIGRPADLAAHKCLVYWLEHENAVWRFMDGDDLRELRVPAALSVNNGLILRDLAIAGHGIALLDDYTVVDALEAGALVRVLPDVRVTNTTFDEGMYATFVEAAPVPAKIRVFLDFVVAELKPIMARRDTILRSSGADAANP